VNKIESLQTKLIANLRIHVEKAIKRITELNILNGPDSNNYSLFLTAVFILIWKV